MAAETARRACSSRAMRYLHVQVRSDTENLGKHTNSLRILSHRTTSPAIAHAGDWVLPAHGSLSQGLSRVEELSATAPHQYEAGPRDLQRVIWSFFDSRQSLVNPCESGVYEHRQRVVCPSIEGLCLAFQMVCLRDQQTSKPSSCALMHQSDRLLWLGSAADPASLRRSSQLRQ